MFPEPRITDAKVFMSQTPIDPANATFEYAIACRQCLVAAAKRSKHGGAEGEHQHGVQRSRRQPYPHRVHGKRVRARSIPGAERAAHGGRHAAAHRAARQHQLQHYHRKYERHPGQ